MFMSGTCKTTFPENSEIKRISFLKLNYDMTWKSVYGSVDLEIGTATYAYVSGSLSAPRDYQIFVLSGPEIEKCRNAFDSTLLHDEVQLGKGFGVHTLLLGLFLYLPGKVVVHPVDIGHQLGYAVGNLHLN